MKKMEDKEYIKGLQSNLRVVFETAAGKEVMAFLEEAVGYDASIFDPASRENTWIQDGKRQVVATIKSLMKLTPDQVVAMTTEKEE